MALRVSIFVGVLLYFMTLFGLSADRAQGATQAEINTAELAAFQVWPSGPCKDAQGTLHINLVVDPPEVIDGRTGFHGTGGAAVQNNADGTCTIFVVQSVYDAGGYDFCTTLVHEYGHLSGANHGDANMGPYGTSFAPCLTMTPRLTTLQSVKAIRTKVGQGWRIHCGLSHFYPSDGDCTANRNHGKRWRVYSLTLPRLGDPIRVKFLASNFTDPKDFR